jgi:5-methyltetrahydrofolate--homocysteine methyltransferase
MIIEKILKDRILILDGGMGTEILNRLGQNVDFFELLNLEQQSLLVGIHQDYVQAGADIITTNTFGANRIKLAEYGFERKVKAINTAAVDAAIKARGTHPVKIAGSMGPVGRLIRPLGELDEEDVFSAFAEQARILEEAGADILFIETQIDTLEGKIALRAAKENTSLPVSVSMSFPLEKGRTVTGSDPETAAIIFASSQADIFGINCGGHPGEFEKFIPAVLRYSKKPLIIYANAGLPEKKGKRLLYPLGPKEYLSFALKYYRLGANIIGGCCGTTPEHTRAIAGRLKGKKPRPTQGTAEDFFQAASRNATLTIGSSLPFRIVGENINPFGRSQLSQELESENLNLVRASARRQDRVGADALDVNLGKQGEKSPSFFAQAVRELQSITRLPLFLDNMNPVSLEKALQIYGGKAVINSVNGIQKNFEVLFPLARKYGAAVILLAMDEKGIPEKATARFRIIEKLFKQAGKYGLSAADILADPVVLTLSVSPGAAQETLKTVGKIKSLGLSTICGLSNLSFGLPQRGLINASFLPMAMAGGLDSAILNPLDGNLMAVAKSGSAVLDKKQGMRLFLNAFRKKPEIAVTPEREKLHDKPEKVLFQAILEGERPEAARLTEQLIASGWNGFDILEKILSPALRTVGERYEERTYFLPQLVLAAEAMEEASHVLEKYLDLKARTDKRIGVVLATVSGDLHDIGKNIVSLVMKNYGFRVWDLGKNVEAEKIIDTAIKKRADIIGLSALMTTTMDEMENVLKLKKKKAPGIKVIIGGAAVTPSFARRIGADAYGKNALDGVRKIEELTGRKK